MYCYTPTYYFGTEPQETGAIKNLTCKKSEKKARRKFKYKYNGKEWQDELGLQWYDYGARNYDPALGRWMNIDPLAEKYYPVTPYQYVINNPIANIDKEGKWTVSVHYSLTYNALSATGMDRKQADLLAHYASVYADNPKKYLYLNNIVHQTPYHYYRNDIDYSRTNNSQVTRWNGYGTNYNIWHSMRSPYEKNYYQISEKEAMQRGMRFGWNKIFESAKSGSLNDLEKNSEAIQDFGQGLHALQDAYAHKGVSIEEHNAYNDAFGDTSEAFDITKSAVSVHNLLSRDWDALDKSGITIKFDGMSNKQITTVLNRIQEYLNRDKDEK